MEDGGFTIAMPAAATPAGVGGLPTAAELTRLQAHPQFAAAVVMATAGMADLYQGNRILNSLINDRARLLFGMLALDLHYSGQADGDIGFTVTQAQENCVAHGICSAGRAAAMIALMRFGGYIETLPSRDRRRRLLGVTDKLVAAHQARWRRLFEAIALVRTEGKTALAALDRPAFTRIYARLLADDFRAGLRILVDSAPELALFAERNSGMVILFRLLADSGAGMEPVPVSISALAGRYGVSRAHVGKLLRDAENEDFLVLTDARGYCAALTPRLLTAANTFFATTFLYVGRCAAEAAARTSKGMAED
jgi:hypothetical protein